MSGQIVAVILVLPGRNDKKKFRIVKETVGRNGTVRKTLRDGINSMSAAQAIVAKWGVMQ